MREITFRAWDKKRQRILGPWSLIDISYKSDGGIIDIKDWDDLVHADDLIWMQFTGLKDKNGKEIYEGDIVYHEMAAEDDMAKGYGIKAEVMWDSENAGFMAMDDELGDNILSCYDVEVIGNIYENPELLEEK